MIHAGDEKRGTCLYPSIICALICFVFAAVSLAFPVSYRYWGYIAVGIGMLCLVWRMSFLFRSRKVIQRCIKSFFVISVVCFLLLENVIIFAGINKTMADTDIVIVLGCSVRSDGEVSPTLQDRLDVAIDYLNAYPDINCIVCGGRGVNEPVSEAAAMKNYLLSNGIDEERVLVEDRSSNTEENLAFAKELLIDKSIWHEGMKATIVSNDFHLLRAELLAKKMSYTPYGLGTVGDEPIVRINGFIRESLAVVKTVIVR